MSVGEQEDKREVLRKSDMSAVCSPCQCVTYFGGFQPTAADFDEGAVREQLS